MSRIKDMKVSKIVPLYQFELIIMIENKKKMKIEKKKIMMVMNINYFVLFDGYSSFSRLVLC